MANFKTCSNGHNYDANQYAECPFCPANSSFPDYEKTVMDFKKTEAFDSGSQFAKTMINEENIDFKKTSPGGNVQHPFSRTTISGPENPTPAPVATTDKEKRKLVGWLVTFTHDESGEDFKIYMGKNKIGSAAPVDVLINDSSVSADHATILFRENEFLIRDNFSTNGTRINGVMEDEQKLKDGDEIKVGNTVLKFKTVF